MTSASGTWLDLFLGLQRKLPHLQMFLPRGVRRNGHPTFWCFNERPHEGASRRARAIDLVVRRGGQVCLIPRDVARFVPWETPGADYLMAQEIVSRPGYCGDWEPEPVEKFGYKVR